MVVPQDFIYAYNSSNPINNKTALHNAGKVKVNPAHEETKSVTVNKDMIRRKEEPYLTMKKTTSTSLDEKCCETHFFFVCVKISWQATLKLPFLRYLVNFPRRRETACALIWWYVPLTCKCRLISAEVTGHSPVCPLTHSLKIRLVLTPANNDVIVRDQDGTRIIFSSRS